MVPVATWRVEPSGSRIVSSSSASSIANLTRRVPTEERQKLERNQEKEHQKMQQQKADDARQQQPRRWAVADGRRQRKGRTRPHHDSAGRTESHRRYCAAILTDRHR